MTRAKLGKATPSIAWGMARYRRFNPAAAHLNQPALTGGFLGPKKRPQPTELGPKFGSAGREGSDTISDVVSQSRLDH
jgi:hypothetical protein